MSVSDPRSDHIQAIEADLSLLRREYEAAPADDFAARLRLHDGIMRLEMHLQILQERALGAGTAESDAPSSDTHRLGELPIRLHGAEPAPMG